MAYGFGLSMGEKWRKPGMLFLADNLKDYVILDTGDGMKLEKWGGYILSRPDPQIIWEKQEPELWEQADAEYIRSSSGGGKWRFRKELPERWTFGYGKLRFYVRPTGFKHTGLFPEQSVNWDFMASKIRGSAKKDIRVLNLFAYTGAATCACAAEGAAVVHVDAAKSMNQWAKENALHSGLGDANIRYLQDDCLKFVQREIRRGNRYDGIVMDPPSYGRGSGGQIWKVEDDLFALIKETVKLLSDSPLFFIVNSYTTGLSSVVTGNMLRILLRSGSVTSGDVAIPTANRKVYLPCGTTARWEV